MDVDNLLPGERFDLRLKEALAGTDVFLAVIGARWPELLEARAESGERDYVREEIAAALAAKIVVIPVLMDRAALPKAASLPEDIRELALYHKHDVVYESFGRDVAALIVAIETHRQAKETAARLAWERQAEAARLAREQEQAEIEAARRARQKAKEEAEAERRAQAEQAAEAARRTREKQPQAQAQRGPEPGAVPWKPAAAGLAVVALAVFIMWWQRPHTPPPGPGETARSQQQAAVAEAARKEAEAKIAAALAAQKTANERAERAAAEVSTPKPLKDCSDCPEMVPVQAGSFTMGSSDTEIAALVKEYGKHYEQSAKLESPQHRVTISKPFAVGKYDVTFDEWDACVSGGGCTGNRSPSDEGSGKGRRPVINVSWDDAQEYVKWLSAKTRKQYRLLSEAEWEYAARAGTQTRYYWGETLGKNHANCEGCGSEWDEKGHAPVGSFAPNAFGLYDMAGNVWQWTEDCWNESYHNGPNDEQAMATGNCAQRVFRGGCRGNSRWNVRATARYPGTSDFRYNIGVGFRVARTLTLNPCFDTTCAPAGICFLFCESSFLVVSVSSTRVRVGQAEEQGQHREAWHSLRCNR